MTDSLSPIAYDQMIAFNQSRVKLFRRCQRAYAFRYDTVEGKELVPRVTKEALYKGSWLHSLLEAHHKHWAGEETSWQQVHMELTLKFNQLFEEEQVEYGDMPTECEQTFRAYLRYWKQDIERYTPVDSEFIIESELPTGQRFKGRVDLMVEDHELGGLWLWDAKWVSRIPSDDSRMMQPQALMYVWSARKNKLDVRGFVYNYGRTKTPTFPHTLMNGTISLAKKYDTDYYTFIQAIKVAHGDDWRQWAKNYYYDKLMEAKAREVTWFRRERIPVEPDRIKRALTEYLVTVGDIERRNVKHPPRSYNYTCQYGCEYHELCVAEFTGLDITNLLAAHYTVEDERYTQVGDEN